MTGRAITISSPIARLRATVLAGGMPRCSAAQVELQKLSANLCARRLSGGLGPPAKPTGASLFPRIADCNRALIRSPFSRGRVAASRQPHRELGELADLAIHRDRAAVLQGYDFVTYRQAK